MPYKKRVVCYVNQFFGQIGGEEKAHIPPRSKEGAVGTARAIEEAFKGQAQVVGTVICGDTYFNEEEQAGKEILEMIRDFSPHLLLAGPAFNAGRYGMACGAVAKLVQEELDLPVISGMYRENPGAEMYRQYGYFVETSNSAAGMRTALENMAALALKVLQGKTIGPPEREGYLPRGIRVNTFVEERGSKRAVTMLLKKMRGEVFTSEYPMPTFDRVPPAPPVRDTKQATIAIITSGGIVPRGNPDHIESSSASRYGMYALGDQEELSPEKYETTHGGYDPISANEDPNRIVPLDVLKDMEKEGTIEKLYPHFFSTVGNGTSVENAQTFARDIVKRLNGVQGVILTST